MSRSAATLIIGAGPAGLGCALRLGKSAVILEQLSEVGGLSRSIEIQDGVFDIGGHSFHTPHENVRSLVLDVMAGRFAEQRRDARVWFGNELIPYPFQAHFTALTDPEIVAACSGHRADPVAVSKSRSFEEWILLRFGKGIAEHFMLPYNRKLWARDLKSMSSEWVIERVAGTQEQPSKAGVEQKRKPLQSDSMVGYPTSGGFGEIFKALAARCHHIEFGERVEAISPSRRQLRTSNGRIWDWSNLVSTMPLPILLSKIEDCDPHMIALANTLQCVSLKILLLLIRSRSHDVPQRVYVADPTIFPHKIAFNHTSSLELRQRAHQAICCEISYSPDKPAPPDNVLVENSLKWLVACGYLTSADDLVSQRVIDVGYGYPVYTDVRAAIVEKISGYLRDMRIYTIGRFGAWIYANSDECLRQGLELGDAIAAKSEPRS